MKIHSFGNLREARKFVREWMSNFSDEEWSNNLVVYTNDNRKWLVSSHNMASYETYVSPLMQKLDELEGLISLIKDGDGNYGFFVSDQPFDPIVNKKYSLDKYCRVFEGDGIGLIEFDEDENNKYMFILKDKIINKFSDCINKTFEISRKQMIISMGMILQLQMHRMDLNDADSDDFLDFDEP